MVTKKVKPCGKVYWQDKEYFLLNPEPFPVAHPWEGYCWKVIPNYLKEKDRVLRVESGDILYPPAIDILCGDNALIEFIPDMPELQVEVKSIQDITDEMLDEPTNNVEPSPEELQQIYDDVEQEILEDEVQTWQENL